MGHLLVQAVEEERDVVLEAGDSRGGGGPTGAEPGVGRGGIEAVGVGESGARHGQRPAPRSSPGSRAGTGDHRREVVVRVYSSESRLLFVVAWKWKPAVVELAPRSGGRRRADAGAARGRRF